jgi:ABC-type Na+ efflux pump permease subunit
VRTTRIPVGMMMILLFSVMSGAPQLLNSVIEEKMSRISEVLIGSITPFELMMGKLLGCVRCRCCSHGLLVGGIAVAQHFGYGDAVHLSDMAWLLVFLIWRRSCSARSSSPSAPPARI